MGWSMGAEHRPWSWSMPECWPHSYNSAEDQCVPLLNIVASCRLHTTTCPGPGRTCCDACMGRKCVGMMWMMLMDHLGWRAHGDEMSVSLPLSQKGWKTLCIHNDVSVSANLEQSQMRYPNPISFWHSFEIASIVDVSKVPAHTRPKDTQSLIELTSELCMYHQMDMIAFDVMSPDVTWIHVIYGHFVGNFGQFDKCRKYLWQRF